MREKLLYIILGIFITISIAANSNTLFEIKPKLPKTVFVKECRSEEAVIYIKDYSRKGYIFKSFTSGAYYDYDGLLIMEKYE